MSVPESLRKSKKFSGSLTSGTARVCSPFSSGAGSIFLLAPGPEESVLDLEESVLDLEESVLDLEESDLALTLQEISTTSHSCLN